MIRVLAIYPAFDVSVNEMAIVWQSLCSEKPVFCTVLAGPVDNLKAKLSVKHERHENIEIFRSLHQDSIHDLGAIARESKPDLIFCAVPLNMPVALQIKKAVNVPILLHTEYFIDDRTVLRRRNYLGIVPLRPIACAIYRRILTSRSALILCSNPVEFQESRAARPSLQYLPWPHPGQLPPLPYEMRDRFSCVYVGSLSREKGAETLSFFIRHLLRKRTEFRFTMIGPAMDQAGVKAIESLRAAGAGRVDIGSGCSRSDAIAAIRKANMVFSPGKRFGWGLIGDGWTSGTPVIAAGRHYDLKDQANCWIAQDQREFANAALSLANDKDAWNRISSEGVRTARTRHSIELVAEKLYGYLVLAANAPEPQSWKKSIAH